MFVCLVLLAFIWVGLLGWCWRGKRWEWNVDSSSCWNADSSRCCGVGCHLWFLDGLMVVWVDVIRQFVHFVFIISCRRFVVYFFTDSVIAADKVFF